MEYNIQTLDLVIIGLYFFVVLLIGVVIARKTETGEDLFLGGRTFTFGLIGLSLFASNISSTTLIGLSGAAYKSGIVQSVYEWMSGIPLIIAALIFIPLYLKSKITTIPEFLELRFDRRSRVFFSLVTIITSVLVDMAGGLYAGSLVLQVFFPNLVLWQTCLFLALVAGFYTAFGGLKAVVYTDAIQAIILIVACSILTYIMFSKLDFSIDTVLNSVPEGHFSIVRPLDDESLPWTGLIIGVPFLGIWYWTTNQYIVQRVLGAKNIQHARWGVVLAGFLKVIPLFIMVIPGALAITLIPGIENADSVFPTAVMTLLPSGLIGLVLAGLISAIMSSVDSTLNSASTLVVVDFIKANKPTISEKEVTKFGRITTFILMVVAALWAPQIGNFEGVWVYLQQMFSIIVPPVVVVFLLGVLYPKGNGSGSIVTLTVGTVLGAILFVLGVYDYWTLHFTTNVGLMTLICSILFVVVSNMYPQPVDERYIFKKELMHEGMEGVVWYTDYRIHIGLLCVLMTVILLIFW